MFKRHNRRPNRLSMFSFDSLEQRVLLSAAEGQIFVTDESNNTIGEYTTSGATVNGSLVSGLGAPSGIALSGSDLFVTNAQTNTIGEYTTSGTTVNAALVSGLSEPLNIAVSGSDLFVANGSEFGGTIGEYTTSGSTVNASLISGLDPAEGIAVSGSDLFVVTASGETGKIGEYTTSGATVNASLVTGLSLPEQVAVSGSDLFVTNEDGDTIGEYTTSGVTVNASLVSGLRTPVGIALSGSDLFVANFGTIGQYTTSGATVNAALVSGLGRTGGICVGASSVVGPASQLSFGQQPTGVAASSALSPAVTVNVEDANGNVVSSDASTVTLSIASGPAGGVLGGTVNAMVVNGAATFSNLSLSEVGTYMLTASDGALSSANSTAFNVVSTTSGGHIFVANQTDGTIGAYTTSGATVNASLVSGLTDPDHIAVSGSDLFVTNPGTIGEYTTSGMTVNPSLVSGLDGTGGIAVSGSDLFVVNYLSGTVGEYTTSGATVDASLVSGLSEPQAIAVSGPDLFVASSNDGTIGEYTTSGATVNASLVSGLDGPDGIAISGSDLFVAIYNNSTIGEYTTLGATVNASLISELSGAYGIAISGSDLFVADNAGVGVYTTSGATVNAALVSSSGAFFEGICVASQVVGPASQLAFAQQPTSVTAGGAVSPAVTVNVEDADGNVVSGDTSTVTLSIAAGPAGGVLGGTVSAAAVNGVVTFADLSFNIAGSYTLTASDGSDAPIASTSFTVSPMNQLAFSEEPADTTTVSTPGTITVDVEDSNGNLLTSDNSTVTLAIASGPGGASLGGATTVQAVNGVATFGDLSITTPGDNYTLTATDGGDSPATSTSFNVSLPNTLAFVREPANATTAGALDPITVDVDDSNRNLVAGDNSDVTLAIAGGPGGATLGGATTVAAVNGVATFSDLSITTVGDNYTLIASDPTASSDTSTPFNIIAPPPPSPVVPTLGNVTLPPAVVAGAKFKARVPVVITNHGSDFKGEFITVNLYADTRSKLDSNQMPVTSLRKKVSLKTGGRQDFTFNIKSLPSTLPDGTYYLLAEVVDPSGDTNVIATPQTVTVAPAFIQPSVSVGAAMPVSITIGKSGLILITVTNDGNVAASGVGIALSPSEDGVTPVAGVILQSIRSGAKIQPGKSKTFKLHFKVSSALAAGSYHPYVSVTLGGISTTQVGMASFTAE